MGLLLLVCSIRSIRGLFSEDGHDFCVCTLTMLVFKIVVGL